MTVLIDSNMRFYFLVSNQNGVMRIIERGSAGGEYVHSVGEKKVATCLIRRKAGEDELIGIRHLHSEDADKLFAIAENVSGGELLKCWMRAHAWRVTPEAMEVINRVVWIEDRVEYLKARAAQRQASPKKWLDLARRRGARI